MIIHTIKSNLRGRYASVQTIVQSQSFLKNLFKSQLIAEHYRKKRYALASSHLLAAVIAAMVLVSCQKEQVSNPDALNSTSSDASAEARYRHSSGGGGSSSSGGGSSSGDVNYGAVIIPPSSRNFLEFQQNVARSLGVTCLRGGTPVSSGGKPVILSSGYDVLLNFNTGTNQNSPSPFVSDLSRYSSNLKSMISGFSVKPKVAVIENEESNRYYYSGSAQQYINELSTAIGVMHSNGIKVANGGITSQGLNYLVYQDFMSQHKSDSADHFRNLTGIGLQDPDTKDRGNFIDILLTNYAKMDLDYVNFHWKGTSPDTYALNCVINYLKKRTGKPVISNELGQFDNNTSTLTAMVKLCADQKFPYILWISPDENTRPKETPLNHDDQSLTSTGVAYKNYLAQ